MKKFVTGLMFIVLAIFIVTIVGSLMQRQSILYRSALTIEELDAFAVQWGVVAGTAQRPALKRTLTKTEKDSIDESRAQDRNGVYDKATLQFTELLAGALRLAEIDAGAGFYFYDTAGVAESMGDWETARQYYLKALEYPLMGMHREDCLIRLAWLVDDSVVADKLLDVACPPGGPCPVHVLYKATDLAWRTGSGDSYDYYLGLLRTTSPRLASEFDHRKRPEG